MVSLEMSGNLKSDFQAWKSHETFFFLSLILLIGREEYSSTGYWKLWVDVENTSPIFQNKESGWETEQKMKPVSGFNHSPPKLPMKETFILPFTALVKKKGSDLETKCQPASASEVL